MGALGKAGGSEQLRDIFPQPSEAAEPLFAMREKRARIESRMDMPGCIARWLRLKGWEVGGDVLVYPLVVFLTRKVFCGCNELFKDL